MTGTCKLTRKRFPNLEFPDDRMAAVYDLLLELDHQGHPNASEIQKEFFARLEYLNDYGGAVSEDGRVLGTYLHGLFDNDGFRHALLAPFRDAGAATQSFAERKEEGYSKLADLLRGCLDMGEIYRILG